MSLFDPNRDFEAPRGLPVSSAELADIFGYGDTDDTGEPQESDDLYRAALEWTKRGYNAVPQKAGGQKHPGVKWKDLQTRRATEEELLRWQPMFSNGVGFITGKISGVIVVETDGPEGETLLDEFARLHGPLPETLVILSGSGRGLHRHFKHPGYKVKTKANPAIKIDVKGDAGFCVLPPSPHKSGGRYEIEHDEEPAELPRGLLKFIDAAAKAANGAQGNPDTMKGGGDCSGLSLLGEPPDPLGNCGLEPNIPPCKTWQLPPVETMRAMLQHLADKNYFEDREDVVKDANGRIVKIGWLETGMALKPAYGDEVGFDLWAVTHLDEKARNDAPGQWASFASEPRPGHVTIGRIIKAAKDAGFVFARNRADDAEPGYVSYGPFTMDADDGLTKIGKRGKNATVETDWISGPVEVLGACRDPHGRAWGKYLRFRDGDSRVHMRHVCDAALQGDHASLCATLADEGLAISRSKQREFAEYLSGVSVGTRITIVDRTGWHEVGGQHVFILPPGPIGACEGETVILDGGANGPYEARGALEDWKLGIGALTAGHALPVFMVSAALAGPLAYLVGAEGGGIHIFGPSSIGKSAMLQAAASVWGRGGTPGYVRSWRATANGLEGAAGGATDTCLVLDELGIGEARDVAAAVYTLAIGVGKQRAGRDGSARSPKTWRVFTLSSGEITVATKLGEEPGKKIRAGQTVRLLDISADRARGFGAFDHGGNYGDAGELADAIKNSATAAYGTAGPAFVERVIATDVAKIADIGGKFIAKFVRHVIVPGASEQIARAAKTFALIAFAGELATGLGVTPWEKGEARLAAIWAFSRWVEKRGGTGSFEERQAIEQVRLMIEQHGEARFEHADGSAQSVHNRLGWRKGEGAQREWWVPAETWKAVFCTGLDPTFVARTLAEHRMLRRQDGTHLQCVVSISKHSTRVYVLTSAILDGSEVND